MGLESKIRAGALGVVLATPAHAAQAQDAKQIVQQAVNTQLAADRDDHTHWRYIRTDDGKDKIVVVETENGAITRHIEVNGQACFGGDAGGQTTEIQKFIHDPAMQQKQRQNGAHDDKSATELLNLMPQAFVWKVESQTPESITLSYRPNPNFDPPDMEARVMGAMTGTMTVTRPGHRIRTFKGRLENDVTIGFGFLARIKAGSNVRHRAARSCAGSVADYGDACAHQRPCAVLQDDRDAGGRGEVGLHAGAAGDDAGAGGGNAEAVSRRPRRRAAASERTTAAR